MKHLDVQPDGTLTPRPDVPVEHITLMNGDELSLSLTPKNNLIELTFETDEKIIHVVRHGPTPMWLGYTQCGRKHYPEHIPGIVASLRRRLVHWLDPDDRSDW